MPRETLDELEGVEWGEPGFNSLLVRESHRLRKKPVDEFTVEELRVMIGQQIGLDHLMPRAVNFLERQPLAEGDFFPGDLLLNVIRASDWLRARPEVHARIESIIQRALNEIREVPADTA